MSSNLSASARADVYTRITAEIIAAIESDPGSWRMPWHHHGNAIARPTNVASGKRYRGINVLALWIAADSARYSAGLWGTYRQWMAAGAHVRKGERATTVVLWKEYQSARDDDEGDDDGRRTRLFARAFSVFNAAQVDDYKASKCVELEASDQTKAADAFFAALGITASFGAYDAHYRISEDRIYMPVVGAFRDGASYAGTLLHEAAHATGAKQRLDRNFGERFADQARAMEEAVAELTASYVLADLGIAHHPRPDHAAYIASWLELLKHDPRAIFTAASKAQQAADWMHACQPAAREAA
ncbi:MAG: zincin-like metallopeptidase domain-containing protein [Rhizomicrobium sp.]